MMAKIRKFLINHKMARVILLLADLQKIAFAAYIPKKKFKFPTKKWFRYQNRLWLRLTQLNTVEKTAYDTALFNAINDLVEVFFALHQLRHREHSPAIFELCFYEMAALQHSSVKLLIKLAYVLRHPPPPQREWDERALLDNIEAFESVFQRVLQIACPVPLVFSFFIQDLYAYDAALQKVYQHVVREQ